MALYAEDPGNTGARVGNSGEYSAPQMGCHGEHAFCREQMQLVVCACFEQPQEPCSLTCCKPERDWLTSST